MSCSRTQHSGGRFRTPDLSLRSPTLYHWATALPKLLWSPILFPFFFYVSRYVYSPVQGQTIHWGHNFDDNRKAFSLCPYVASFKMISSKSDFIHICNDFIHVYIPRARTENPLGTNFWCQQKALITLTICCKFQKSLFEFWFYTHFFMFFHMYIAPGQG